MIKYIFQKMLDLSLQIRILIVQAISGDHRKIYCKMKR